MASTPAEGTRKVVPCSERQNRDGRRVFEAGRVKQREHPTDCTVAPADKDAETTNGAEGLEGLLRMPLAKINHLQHMSR